MIGVLDLQPTTAATSTVPTSTTTDLPDRCFICKQQKQSTINENKVQKERNILLIL